jgi:hypothetical protein
MFLESINRKFIDKLASSYASHAMLRDSEAVLMLTGTLIGAVGGRGLWTAAV